MTTLADLRRALDTAVAELPSAELADAIGILGAASVRLTGRLIAPPSVVPLRLVGAREMAAILDVPENWVRDKARAGALPSHQLGHYRRFSPPDVLEAVRRLPKLHDSQLRGLKKAKEARGGKRPVSNGCPSSDAGNGAENQGATRAH